MDILIDHNIVSLQDFLRGELDAAQREGRALALSDEAVKSIISACDRADLRHKNIDEVIDDAMTRFNHLYDTWRDAKSNEEIAGALRSFLTEWTAARDRYQVASRTSTLLAVVQEAQPIVCGALCPSVWKTGERPPHSPLCTRMQEANL